MKINFFLILLIINASAVSAAGPLLHDSNENWVCAVAKFRVNTDSGDALFLQKTLPAYIYNELSLALTHVLSDEEIELTQKRIIENHLRIYREKLSAERKKIDMNFFTGTENLRLIRKNVSDINSTIRYLERYNYKRIKINPEKPVFFINSSEKDYFPDVKKIEIKNITEKENIEYLIYGSLDVFESIVFIDLFLYSRLKNKNLYEINIVAEIDDVYESLNKPLAELTTIILGRPWAKLDIVTQNTFADIYVNNIFRGSRDVRNLVLKPGIHTITAAGQGIERKEVEIILSENDHLTVELDSVYKEEILKAVNTLPLNADVYYDSVWRGKSPVIINGGKGELFIMKEGYRNTRLNFEDYKENFFELQLSPEIFKKEIYLENRRNIFYRNLSYFILSIPVPLFMFALVNDYNTAYTSAYISGNNPDEIERLRRARTYTYYGYYSTLFISISLFTNMIFHLGDYIEAGDILNQRR